MEGDYAIASFRSRQQVMNFESQLRNAGVHGEVVSTPREIAVGCGLSVKFAYTDFPRVREMCPQIAACKYDRHIPRRQSAGQSGAIHADYGFARLVIGATKGLRPAEKGI